MSSEDGIAKTDVASNERAISQAKEYLRSHLEESKGTFVLFFVELAPYSSNGAACRHPTCAKRIDSRGYRMAIYPGVTEYSWKDFYHVRCFEDLVDFSQPLYLDRITPVTRNTAGVRGLKAASIVDGNFFLDGGAERLILEWKVSMGRLIDGRDGVAVEPMDAEFDDLLRKSGSASYTPKQMEKMTFQEFHNLAGDLAPIESDGTDDRDEWNLFEQYLPKDFDKVEDLNDPHSLSDMLELWKCDKFLACADESELSDMGKKLKGELGEKAARAIQRLSSIPMLDLQSIVRRGFGG